MHKLAVGGLIALMLGGAVGVADSAYIIRLKNGNEYITDRYWYERAQVLFDTYGGVFGVDKGYIVKIEKSGQVLRLAERTERESVKTSQISADQPGKDSAVKVEVKVEKKRDANDPVLSEYNRLKEKSREVAGMLTSEIRDLLTEITAFKNKLSRDSKLFFEYAQEFNDAREIAETVEAALRSRSQ